MEKMKQKWLLINREPDMRSSVWLWCFAPTQTSCHTGTLLRTTQKSFSNFYSIRIFVSSILLLIRDGLSVRSFCHVWAVQALNYGQTSMVSTLTSLNASTWIILSWIASLQSIWLHCLTCLQVPGHFLCVNWHTGIKHFHSESTTTQHNSQKTTDNIKWHHQNKCVISTRLRNIRPDWQQVINV